MAAHSDAYNQGLAQLLNAPLGSMPRSIGTTLAAFDRIDDNAGLVGYLSDLYRHDPIGGTEFQIANDMMHRLHEAGA